MGASLAGMLAAIPIEDLAVGARLVRDLPVFLRRPIGSEQARATLRRRFERRDVDFLVLVKRAVYGHAASPYRELLRLAGCEYGDFEALVRRDGVEGTLHTLLRQGVYLTVNELKGRRPTVRGSTTIRVDPARLRNPRSGFGISSRTSGSRGAGTVVPIDLEFLRDRAVNTRLFLDGRAAGGWQHAIWETPGSSIVTLLRYAHSGARPRRWFSLLDPAGPGLHWRYRRSARTLPWWSLLVGAPIPRPSHVPLDDPLPIARWMSGVLQRGGTPHLDTFVTPAVRVALAARDAAIDLDGAQFTVTGEPLTPARRAVVEGIGAGIVPSYRTAEAGAIGYGCLAPAAADEVHQYHDLVALIQAGSTACPHGLTPSTLLVSSLRPAAPMVLLNTSLGDQATMAPRACGCAMERLGWTTHLHTVRSSEKLTAGGVTFLDWDVIRILEDTLPARFGGAPTDYQLVEEEAPDGHPRLRLLIHPAVGPLDGEAVTDAFLAAIGGGSGSERVMGQVWRDGKLLSVERAPPHATASGKILHLHQQGSHQGRPPAR